MKERWEGNLEEDLEVMVCCDGLFFCIGNIFILILEITFILTGCTLRVFNVTGMAMLLMFVLFCNFYLMCYL